MRKIFFFVSGILFLSCTRVTDLPQVTSPNLVVTDTGLLARSDVSFTGGDRNTTRGFCWSESPNPTISNNSIVVDGQGAGEYSYCIYPLLENTLYYVRAFATNKRGTTYSNDSNAETEVFNLGNAFFNSNGCLECDDYEPGEMFSINGNIYTVAGTDTPLSDLWGNPLNYCTSHITSLANNNNRGGSALVQDITSWDVSNVTSFHKLFLYADFSQLNSSQKSIKGWDVSSATTMESMFENCMFGSDINQDLSEWDVSNVTNMKSMFESSGFNTDISDWDISNVTNMERMFYNTYLFNQDIGDWDVSNVINMNSMFEEAQNFNQNLNSWCVSNSQLTHIDFNKNSSLPYFKCPYWGTCP